ncbi:histidine triad-like motif-containing protein [Ilyonectria destructans]|nr:histidine triad-like motif-containing protein [Ilyonectria destructans]
MEAIKKAYHYLTNLEWTEQVQDNCKFCDRANLASIVYEDDEVIGIENLRLAGQFHWLIMPKLHLVRDIEGLNGEHLPLLQAMDRAKSHLIEEKCPGLSRSDVISGYHRGRRQLLGNIYYPDIISIHHLHLHVIVRPQLFLRIFKYPSWLPLMWKSDTRVMQEIQRLV